MDRKSEAALARRDAWWVVALGLLVQLAWAARLPHPTYMDAYYYATSARRLAQGYGFTTPVVWQFLDGIRQLPAPSHTYWMPLPSLLAAAGYRLADSFRAAQLPFLLLAGLLPLLSYSLSWQLSGERWQARTAALFTAGGGYYAAYLSQPTTFAPFAWAGGLGLMLLARATERQRWPGWLAAGILAGLAHLTRADGLLLLLVALALWLAGVVGRAGARQAAKGSQVPALGALLAGYLLVMAPWFYHNLRVLGRPLATVGTQTMFLTTYDDLFAYNRTFGLDGYLAWGWGNMLRSKLQALWLSVQTFIAVSGLVFLAPLVLLGWVGLGRRPGTRNLLRPLTWYTLALLAAMVLLFTFPAGRGSVLHSSAAIWPWMMPLAVAGLGLAVDWLAARRRHWQPARAKRMFAAMFAVVVFLVSPIVSSRQPLRRQEGETLGKIGQLLPPGSVVMAGNPPMFYYHTGLAAVSVPNEPVERVLEAARQFGARYLVLDEGHPRPLDALYRGEEQVPELRLRWQFGPFQVYELANAPGQQGP